MFRRFYYLFIKYFNIVIQLRVRVMGVEVDTGGHGVQLGGLGDGVDGRGVGVVGGDAQPGQDGRQGHGGAAVRCTDPILALAIHVHTGGVNLDTGY